MARSTYNGASYLSWHPTYHGRLDEAPAVGLRYVGLEHAGGAPGLVHASKHEDLPSTHSGCGRMHRLGEGGHCLPLVGDGVVPGDREGF